MSSGTATVHGSVADEKLGAEFARATGQAMGFVARSSCHECRQSDAWLLVFGTTVMSPFLKSRVCHNACRSCL